MPQLLIYYIILAPPSGKWEAIYIYGHTHYGFSMDLKFDITGELMGCGDDKDVSDWNRNGFDIKGRWSENQLFFEKSYRGSHNVYYHATIDSECTGYIDGWYSLSESGPKANAFYMSTNGNAGRLLIFIVVVALTQKLSQK